MSSDKSMMVLLLVGAYMITQRPQVVQPPRATTGSSMNSLPGNIGQGVGQAVGGALGGLIKGLFNKSSDNNVAVTSTGSAYTLDGAGSMHVPDWGADYQINPTIADDWTMYA